MAEVAQHFHTRIHLLRLAEDLVSPPLVSFARVDERSS